MIDQSRDLDFSLVVPTRNRPGVIARLLDSVAAQTLDRIEVIVVDDASTEPAIVDHSYPFEVLLHRENEPVGACRARNIGIRAARAPLVLFVDDDTELADADLLHRLKIFADEHTDVGVVALAELSPDGSWGFNLAADSAPLEVARFFGCGAMFRAACLAETGGFLEPLGYYYEEFEMSMRVIDRGWRIVFHPEFRIVHYRDATGRDNRRIHRLISRNALLTIAARFPWWMAGPAGAAQLIRFSARCLRRRPADLLGPISAATGAAIRLPRALTHRAPVRAASLRRYRQLAQSPEPLEKAHCEVAS